MQTTHYAVRQRKLTRPCRIALVSDLHDGAGSGVLDRLEREQPDLVALPGDLVDGEGHTARGLAFAAKCARRYPTYVSLGNHESRIDAAILLPALARTGAELLNNRFVVHGELSLGGLDSGWRPGLRQRRSGQTPPPDTTFLSSFSAAPGVRVLLCHHPEYYPRYIRQTPIEIILAGHAHGGQWCFFGRGIFAPGQGLFPRYTAGLYDGRLLVSRGLCRTRRIIPRLFNPRELVILDLLPDKNLDPYVP